MKIALILIILGVCACTKDKKEVIVEVTTNEYADITGTFSMNDFEVAKAFILNNGDREVYRQIDGEHPHYSFDGFEAYLNSETIIRNPNNDPAISDFNQITLRDRNADPQYYYIHIVRKGDNNNTDINKPFEGMKEEKVYLLNPYENDIEVMKNNLKGYIDIIKSNY